MLTVLVFNADQWRNKLALIAFGTTIRNTVGMRHMDLVVRFFALYRERAGCRTTGIELPQGSTVADLTDEVRRRFPLLAPPEVQIVVAVNADYAEPETILRQGDDVCLIPPVSGG